MVVEKLDRNLGRDPIHRNHEMLMEKHTSPEDGFFFFQEKAVYLNCDLEGPSQNCEGERRSPCSFAQLSEVNLHHRKTDRCTAKLSSLSSLTLN